MLDDFFVRALLGGIGVALVSGPLGCIIVWRRMAFFGDAMAHGALLGVALGIALDWFPFVGVLAATSAIALLLLVLQRQSRLSTDTLLGILSHGSLALGLVAVAMLDGQNVNLLGYLFGDILAVDRQGLIVIFAGGGIVLALLAWLWRSLLAITVSEDLAHAEGVAVTPVRIAYMLMVAIVIAIAMKIVGILLVTSMLIIPAASARAFAQSPEVMALGAAGAGALAVMAGLGTSLHLETVPAGPAIVVAAVCLYAVTLPLRWLVGAMRSGQRRS